MLLRCLLLLLLLPALAPGNAPGRRESQLWAADDGDSQPRSLLERFGATGPSDRATDTACHDGCWRSWPTTNPLAGLPALPKVHYAYPYPSCGVPPEACMPSKGDPGNLSRVHMTLSRALLIDTARILGSLPVPARNNPAPAGSGPPALSPAQYDTLVGVAVEAGRMGSGRLPVLTMTYSPWYSEFKGKRDPLSTDGEAAEMAAWHAEILEVRAGLVNASLRAGVAAASGGSSTATIGAVLVDSESFGWCHRYHNAAAFKAAVGRKNELVFNMTRSVFPSADIVFYSYGEPWYLPVNPNRE